jgi:hypothetical protein
LIIGGFSVEILIGNHKKSYKDAPGATTRAIKYISSFLEENSLILGSVRINDEITLDHSAYINYLDENKFPVSRIEVTAQSPENLVIEMMEEAHKYIHRTLPLLSGVAESFVIHPDSSAWKSFSELIEGVEWLHSLVTQANLHLVDSFKLSESMQKRLKNWLAEMESAMSNMDYGLVADLIQYEMMEIYQDLYNAIGLQIQSKKG